MTESGVKIKSLAKAIRILECFMTEPELGVTEISKRLGLNKSNVCDILMTFQELGYIEQRQSTGKYRLGYRILELSHALASSLGFRRTVYPHMKQLAEKVGETVYLGIPNGFDVVYLDAAYPGHEYMTRSMLGDRAHMYCTGIGKAILSQMDPKQWDLLLSQPLVAYTASTIVDPDRLREDLRRTRERGYAIDNMEHEHGVRCVGVPIVNSMGEAVAGMSISCPSLRLDDDKVALYAKSLQDIARRVGNFF